MLVIMKVQKISLLWKSIEGFSKVFSYTGNGNADGTFVYCGFRPRFILIKIANFTTGWYTLDVARNTYNAMNNYLLPNTTAAEAQFTVLDSLSNGFKIRTADNVWNYNTYTFVGLAIAEQPGKYSNAR